MIRLLGFMAMFCLIMASEISHSNLVESETSLVKRKRSEARGYYGGIGYPYLPFIEPLTILAGLAFIAYIIQVFHAFYHHHHHNPGLVGGVLNNVLPSKTRRLSLSKKKSRIREIRGIHLP